VTSHPPTEPKGRILPFRRRGSLFARPAFRPPAGPVQDLSKYEHAPGEPDDYRHRMLMNAIAAAVTLMLIVAGLWIADVMAHMRKDQDCVLVGRRNCTPVDVPIRPR